MSPEPPPGGGGDPGGEPVGGGGDPGGEPVGGGGEPGGEVPEAPEREMPFTRLGGGSGPWWEWILDLDPFSPTVRGGHRTVGSDPGGTGPGGDTAGGDEGEDGDD